MSALDKCVMNLALEIKLLVMGFVYDEEGDVNIVSIVVLIGIAILLAVLFKGRISELLNTLMDTIGQNATKAVEQ